MWYIQTEPEHTSKHKSIVISFEICVDEGLFLEHLTERKKLYPNYLGINSSWWHIINPYRSYVTPFPELGNVLLSFNTPIQVVLPVHTHKIAIEKIKNHIIDVLLKWLSEEHALYQKEWKKLHSGLTVTKA